MTRYPLEPLAELLDIDLHQPGGTEDQPTGLHLLAERCGISHRTARRYLAAGLNPHQADEVAIRAGHHPALIWPTWHHDIDDDQDEPARTPQISMLDWLDDLDAAS